MDRLADTDLQQMLLRIKNTAESQNSVLSEGNYSKNNEMVTWPIDQVAAPSAMLRSALFGIGMRQKKSFISDLTLMSWSGVSIQYTGPELNQNDLDVWMEIVSISCDQMGEKVYFTRHSVLKSLSKKTNNTKWLDSVLKRLTSALIEVETPNVKYVGHLIDEFELDKTNNQYYIRVNKRISMLFGNDNYTLMKKRLRSSLNRELSKWLLGYVNSHQASKINPHYVSLCKIKDLCGSKTKETRVFKYHVKQACEELLSNGVVTEWNITNGQLSFVRSST